MNVRRKCNMLVSSQLCLLHSFHLSSVHCFIEPEQNYIKIFQIKMLVKFFQRCIWFMQIKFYSSLIVKLIHPHSSQYFLVIFIVVNTVSSRNASSSKSPQQTDLKRKISFFFIWSKQRAAERNPNCENTLGHRRHVGFSARYGVVLHVPKIAFLYLINIFNKSQYVQSYHVHCVTL